MERKTNSIKKGTWGNMTIMETWERIKKTIVRDSNGEEDTLEWVYRNDVKAIEKFIKEHNEARKEVVEIKGQLDIYDFLK